MHETKKKKGNSSMQRWRIFRWIAIAMIVFVVIIIVLAIFGPVIGGGGLITQTSLDAQYVPTAEYLLDNPIPTPEGFPASLAVEQDVHGFQVESENADRFCVQGFVPDDTDVAVQFNKYEVHGHYEMAMSGLIDPSGRILSHCIEGVVETGLHLLSVQMTSSSSTWSNKTYSYTWAIEITNDGYRYMPNYLFHNESD